MARPKKTDVETTSTLATTESATQDTSHIGTIRLPGKDLSSMPKGPPKNIPDGRPQKPNTTQTLRALIIEDHTKEYLIPFLKDLGLKRKTGPWRKYLEFYTLNHSGDINSMDAKNQEYCHKMREDLNNEYLEEEMR